MTKPLHPRQLPYMTIGGFSLTAALVDQDATASAQAACLQAFARELDYLGRTLRRLGAPASDIEDLVHEVFLVLCRKWAGYDPTRPLRAYLFGIAFRVTAAHQRRAHREVPTETLIEVDDGAPHPDERLEIAEARALVLRALEAVPLKRRAVLILHDLDEMPMHDIAAVLAIPRFTAYSRLRKARKELQAAILSIRANERHP